MLCGDRIIVRRIFSLRPLARIAMVLLRVCISVCHVRNRLKYIILFKKIINRVIIVYYTWNIYIGEESHCAILLSNLISTYPFSTIIGVENRPVDTLELLFFLFRHFYISIKTCGDRRRTPYMYL